MTLNLIIRKETKFNYKRDLTSKQLILRKETLNLSCEQQGF